jgi:hypothetical protein
MKKNYNQPLVEAMTVKAATLMQMASPNALPIGDPVPGEGGA